MFKIILSAILFSSFSFAYGPVLKTGQTKSYDENGGVVTDGSIKDDGYYQAGEARSYTRSSMGIVKDNVTGLEWQDDVDSVQKPWLTQENYDKCTGQNGQSQDMSKCTDTSGDTAMAYCSTLSLDGAGWRLPTIEELETLVDLGQSDPAMTNGAFQHISSLNYGQYWSSSDNVDAKHNSWIISFSHEGERGGINKNDRRSVRCVRGDRVSSSYFSRNDNSGIVTDYTTGLQWQDDYRDNNGNIKTAKWLEGIEYCENLSLGGYGDWRMPNIKELYSIVDVSRVDPSFDPIFQNVANKSFYLTSTTFKKYPELVWVLYSYNGTGGGNPKDRAYYIRCVRNGSDEPIGLSKGLVAHYEFEGNANDSSGNGNNGVVNGGVDYANGIIGKAKKFDGIDDYVAIEPSIDNSFTFVVWFKTSESNSGTKAWEGKHVISNENNSENSTFETGSDIYLTILNNALAFGGFDVDVSEDRALYGSSHVTDNQWHLAVVTHQNHITKLYLDNSLEASSDIYSFRKGTQQLNIGYSLNDIGLYPVPSRFFNGLIDDLRIYNRALNESEIRTLYRQGVSYDDTEPPKEENVDSIEDLHFDDIVKLYRGGYYAVGGKDIYFSGDGEKFTKYPIAYEEGTNLTVYNAIEVNRDNEVVAVGDGGLFAYKHGGYNTGFTVAVDRDYDYLDIAADWNNFVIVGSDGLIRSVSPGSIGDRIDVGTTHDIVAITYNFATESFYAVTNGGEFIKGAMEDKQDYYQFDRLTWSKKTIASGIALTSVAVDYVNEQVRIVVVGEGGKIYYSNDDGATFHESTSPSSESFLGVKVVNGNFIAATAHGLYRSSDGINWVAADTESFSSSQINVITVDDDVLYVMTSDGVRRFSDFANIESGTTKKVTLGGVTVEFENSTVTFTDGNISSFDIEGGDTMYILKDNAPIAKIVLGTDATFTQYSENNSTLASILYKEQAYVEIDGDNTLYYEIGGENYKPVSEGAFWLKDGKIFEKPMFTTVSDQHKETFHSYVDAYIDNQYTSRYNEASENLRKILLSPDNMRTLMHGMVELMSLYSKKLEEFPNTANDLLLGRTDSIFSPLQIATPYFRKLYLDTNSGKIKMSDAYMFLPQIGTGFIGKIIQNKDISALMPKLSCEVKGSQIKGVVKDLTIDIGPFQIYGKKAEVQSSLNDNEKKESIEIDEAGFTLKTPLCSNDYTQCAAQRANIGSKVSSLKLEYDGEHYQMLSGEAGANFAFPPLQLTDKILLTDVAGYMNFKFRDPDTSGVQVYNDPYSDELDNPLYLVGGQGKLIYKRNNYFSITFDGKLDLMFGINSFDTSSIDMQNLYRLGLGVHDFPRFPRAGVFSVKGISGAYQYNKYGGDYWSLGGDLSFYSVGDGASALFAGHANFTVSSTFENWGADLTSLRTKVRGTDFNLDWMHGGGACFFYGNNIHSNFPVTCPSITNCLGQDFGLLPKGDEIFNGLGTGIKVNMAINKGNEPYEMLGFEFANILTGDLAAKFIDESTKKNTTLDLMVRTEVNLPKVKDKNSWLYKILPSDIRDGKNLGTACVSFSTYSITQTDTGVFYDTDYNLGKHWGFYIIAGSGDHKYKLFIPTDKLLDKDKKQLLYMVDMKIQNTAITSRNIVKRAVGDTVNDNFSATGDESLIKFDLSSSNPDLTITTPDGTVLDQNTQSSGDIEVSQKDGEYCVITIYNPSAGSYDIQYTSTGDEQLRVFGANQEPDATLSLSGNTFEFGLNDVDNDPMEYTVALLDENNNSVAELKREDNVSNGDYTYDIPNITYLPTGDYRVALYYKDAYSPMKRLTSVSTIRLTKSIPEISNIQTLVTKAFTYVSWDTIEGVDGYNISLYNDHDEKLYDYNTTVSSFRFFDLAEGNYTAQIYAYDDQNNTNSVVTNTFEVAKITNVQTPIAIDDITVNFDNDNATLSWSSSGADYYRVDISQNGAELLSDFVTTDTQLSLDDSYKAQTVTVTVRAMNTANEAADPFSKQLIVVDPYDGDGDGMSDMWEIYYLQSMSQTADGDYDGDGLTNSDEYSLKTDPSKVDTDGDHVADADDPDPLMKVDRNSNYVADDWETFYGIDDILGDKDADGYANYIEYFAGMNPSVADPAGIDTNIYTNRSYAPVVVSNIEPLSMVSMGDSVTIDLSGSFDLNGDALLYTWKVNAKEVTGYTSPIFTVDTSTTGMKRIEVTVKDSNSSSYRQFAIFVTDGQYDRVEADEGDISLNKFSISIPSAAMEQGSYLVAGDISQAQIPVDIMGREIASDGLVYLYSEGAQFDAPVTITPYLKDDDIIDPYVFNYESSTWTNLVTGETFDPIFRSTVRNRDQNYTISTRETGILVFAKKPEKIDLENVTHITDTGRVYTIDLEQFKAEHNLTRILDVYVGDTDALSARYGVVNGNDEIRLEVYGEGIGRITIIGYDENNVKVSYTYFIDIDMTSNQGIEKPKENRASLVPIINYLLF